MTQERREESHEQEPEVREVQLGAGQAQEAVRIEGEATGPPPPLDSDSTSDDIIKSRDDD